MGILPDWMIEQAKPLSPLEPCVKRPGKVSYGLSSYGYDARLGYRFKVFTPTNCAVVDPKAFDPRSFVEVDLTPKRHTWIDNGGYHFECFDCGAKGKGEDTYWPSTPAAAGYCPKAKGNPPDHILIPPNSFALGETIETFDIPRDCLAVVLGKSTYARCGIIVNVTPLEPEWRGKVTVEISNTTPLPAKVYAGEGMMQVLFYRSDGLIRKALDLIHGALYADAVLGRPSHKTIDDLRRLLNGEDMGSACRTSYADKQGKYQDQTGLVLPMVDGVPVDTNDPRR